MIDFPEIPDSLDKEFNWIAADRTLVSGKSTCLVFFAHKEKPKIHLGSKSYHILWSSSKYTFIKKCSYGRVLHKFDIINTLRYLCPNCRQPTENNGEAWVCNRCAMRHQP